MYFYFNKFSSFSLLTYAIFYSGFILTPYITLTWVIFFYFSYILLFISYQYVQMKLILYILLLNLENFLEVLIIFLVHSSSHWRFFSCTNNIYSKIFIYVFNCEAEYMCKCICFLLHELVLLVKFWRALILYSLFKFQYKKDLLCCCVVL